MARVPQVTRTIVTTEATVMVINKNTNIVTAEIFTLPRKQEDEKKILKVVADQLTEEEVASYVSKVEYKETRYGMTEADFIKLARPLTADEVVEAEKEEKGELNIGRN